MSYASSAHSAPEASPSAVTLEFPIDGSLDLWSQSTIYAGEATDIFSRPMAPSAPRPGRYAQNCPVREDCLDYAIEAAEYDIWSGLDRDSGGTCLRCADGRLVIHKIGEERCPGSNTHPAVDPAIAAWLPVKAGLTAHGLRHSQKTWMVEDSIPEVLSELRLGHEVPGMRGLYSHVSVPMRDALKEALQRRWEQSLRDRAALSPVSAVPALNGLLIPFRAPDVKPKRNRVRLRAA